MNPLSAIWNGLVDLLVSGLALLHDLFEPLFGAHAWGWAIIGLTIVIRVFMLPLAIKQTRSMRAMQALQPKVKAIQARHKPDRDLLKKDPDKYREKKKRANEEVMALYREEGVNPAAGCLPLLLQAPVFFALFRILANTEAELATEPFYVFDQLQTAVNAAGVWGWVLVLLMAASMFLSQRQLQGRTNVEGPQAQQQKILMYVMPVFLAFIAQGLPVGVLLYWVTTNLWQLGQQAVVIREAQHGVAEAAATGGRGSAKAGRPAGTRGARASGGGGGGADRGRKREAAGGDGQRRRSGRGGGKGESAERKDRSGDGVSGRGAAARRDHLPRRPSKRSADPRGR